jgi:hypothetical protein
MGRSLSLIGILVADLSHAGKATGNPEWSLLVRLAAKAVALKKLSRDPLGQADGAIRTSAF